MLTDRFCFIHIPRMGGSAFKALCGEYVPILGNTEHRTGADLAWICVPKVTLLRDPWSWYRSMTAHAATVADTIAPTYAATVRRYLAYPDQTSRAVDQVYRWPWRPAVTALLTDLGYAVSAWEPLERFAAIRATPAALVVADVPLPTADDLRVWRSYGPPL